MATTLSITSPKDYQCFQRNGSNQATIPASGTYTGSDPPSVEARWSGGAWQTIDASVSGGTWSGTMTVQPAGQGTLEVRDSGNHSASASKLYVGIGDVFVVAGQSNAQGHADNPQSYTHATLKASMFRQDDAWAELADPTDSDVAFGSPWPRLATLIMADTGFPVAFITTAKGDTGLVGGTWTKNGAEYADCVQTVTNSGVNSCRAILWHQGETDMNNSAATSTYKTRLTQLVDNLQADVSALAGVKLVCAQVGYKTTGGVAREDVDDIRIAQTQILDEDTDILAGPILFDEYLDGVGGDGVHWETDAQMLLLAQRWWRMLDYHYFGGTDGRPPRYSSSRIVSGGVAVEVTLTGGTSPLVSVDSIGWRVLDQGGLGEPPITGAVLEGTNKVIITGNRVIVSPVTVSFASFNDGAATTIRDSGAIPLPPEPFVDEVVAGLAGTAGGWGRFR